MKYHLLILAVISIQSIGVLAMDTILPKLIQNTYTESGIYNVSQTVTYCGKSDTKTKAIEIPILNIDRFKKEQISIYPNPATDKLFVNIDKNYQEIDVSIFDVSGKILFNRKLKNKSSLTLNLNDLDSSTYIFSLITEGSKFVRKLIVK
ncbi:T9SS type A sorting domain-containing protein [Aequorivita sinensis]|uniref:T9SS type A sorting domain-containing protein n=1 Tax=Aequorivita sinensis TaxID=1382458 RepID=UPI002301A0E7|nr:T9SS type A sorting domain-containing protein [Aequorivita sinensis]